MNNLHIRALVLREHREKLVVPEHEVEDCGEKQRVVHTIPQIVRIKAREGEKTLEVFSVGRQESQCFQGQSLCC